MSAKGQTATFLPTRLRSFVRSEGHVPLLTLVTSHFPIRSIPRQRTAHDLPRASSCLSGYATDETGRDFGPGVERKKKSRQLTLAPAAHLPRMQVPGSAGENGGRGPERAAALPHRRGMITDNPLVTLKKIEEILDKAGIPHNDVVGDLTVVERVRKLADMVDRPALPVSHFTSPDPPEDIVSIDKVADAPR